MPQVPNRVTRPCISVFSRPTPQTQTRRVFQTRLENKAFSPEQMFPGLGDPPGPSRHFQLFLLFHRLLEGTDSFLVTYTSENPTRRKALAAPDSQTPSLATSPPRLHAQSTAIQTQKHLHRLGNGHRESAPVCRGWSPWAGKTQALIRGTASGPRGTAEGLAGQGVRPSPVPALSQPLWGGPAGPQLCSLTPRAAAPWAPKRPRPRPPLRSRSHRDPGPPQGRGHPGPHRSLPGWLVLIRATPGPPRGTDQFPNPGRFLLLQFPPTPGPSLPQGQGPRCWGRGCPRHTHVFLR